MPTVGHSGVRRAVVTEFDAQRLWGRLVYALDERGLSTVDAISAALIARSRQVANDLRIQGTGKTVQVIDFHSTSVHGIGSTENWPQVGQLVEVHLNADERLVAVWY